MYRTIPPNDQGGALRIYLQHRAALVDYATPIAGSRAQAEDLVQEAWLRFHTAWTKDREPGKAIAQPVGYLYRIVRNLALDSVRRSSHETRHDPDGEALETLPAESASPEMTAVYRDELRVVAEALDELPARTRHAFDLHRFGDKTFAEIGRELGISRTLAHNLVQRALLHCMKRLAGETAQPGDAPAKEILGRPGKPPAEEV